MADLGVGVLGVAVLGTAVLHPINVTRRSIAPSFQSAKTPVKTHKASANCTTLVWPCSAPPSVPAWVRASGLEWAPEWAPEWVRASGWTNTQQTESQTLFPSHKSGQPQTRTGGLVFEELQSLPSNVQAEVTHKITRPSGCALACVHARALRNAGVCNNTTCFLDDVCAVCAPVCSM